MVTQFLKPLRPVKKIFIHCSASDRLEDDSVATMTKWHVARGFTTIGYHFYINKKGEVFKGRSLEEIPSAQKGFNTNSIAICCGGLAKDLFTKEQFKSLNELCEQINQAYDRKVTFHGHCEVSTEGKACPVFDYKAVLDLDKLGRKGSTKVAGSIKVDLLPETLEDTLEANNCKICNMIKRFIATLKGYFFP